jgi:hypothetical protein
MKKTLLLVALTLGLIGQAQAFRGKGDSKFNVGADFQNNSTGVQATYDYGLGQNISVGLTFGYALGVDGVEPDGTTPNFDKRAMVRARFNANLGSVLNIDPNLDIYPGLGLSTKNFGGHLGARYFFSEGFGLYTEMAVPFAKYDTGVLTPGQELYNQFVLSLGTSFNF